MGLSASYHEHTGHITHLRPQITNTRAYLPHITNTQAISLICLKSRTHWPYHIIAHLIASNHEHTGHLTAKSRTHWPPYCKITNTLATLLQNHEHTGHLTAKSQTHWPPYCKITNILAILHYSTPYCITNTRAISLHSTLLLPYCLKSQTCRPYHTIAHLTASNHKHTGPYHIARY
jgi:hypothetical protein